MAGAMGKYLYVSDDGNVYWGRFDVSNSAIASMTAYDGTNASDGALPRNVRPRRRYLKHPTSGRERAIICGDSSAGTWTDPVGTVQAMFAYEANASANYTLQGRTGEKMRA